MTQVEFVEIEAILVEDYEGDLFNLKTESEDYVVDGVIVHNCPHEWEIRPDVVPPEHCRILWMGE